ncbi:AraC family transcriptional regulator [Ktedonobacter racemifer]|uniref:Transcriptional regulator, AraC family n=1 Tax=Ktedonobacter racemifer DSM 44963 TaxID=485913 RepID=D6TT93_KTERA|nr:AraC family transcriptional regulator [Ktedonobacter racemifer]EFH83644.1 transcriptional regulator, AraC family [Ktedonobacter racemifer DSM 44963]
MSLYDNSIFACSTFPFHLMPFQLQRGETVELHSHQYVEFAWISQGWGEHLYQKQISAVKEGDVFVIEPGEEHGYQVTGDVLAGYNVMFHPSLLQAEFETLSRVSSFVDFFYVEPFLRQSNHFVKHLQLNPLEQIEMRFLLNRLEREFLKEPDGYRILIKTYLIELFIYLSRCYQAGHHKPLASIANDREIIARISEFIALHHALPLSLDQVSQMSGMSPSAFKTKFKQATGKTFVEFRNEIRLQTARQMLAETEKKILTISQAVGFADLSFFNKSFKQAYGVSPGAYRKQKA